MIDWLTKYNRYGKSSEEQCGRGRAEVDFREKKSANRLFPHQNHLAENRAIR
jgi:hypothetical protein